MRQIPTYVTAVPNGTEKVDSHPSRFEAGLRFNPQGPVSCSRSGGHQLPGLLHPAAWEHHILSYAIQSRDPTGSHGCEDVQRTLLVSRQTD